MLCVSTGIIVLAHYFRMVLTLMMSVCTLVVAVTVVQMTNMPGQQMTNSNGKNISKIRKWWV